MNVAKLRSGFLLSLFLLFAAAASAAPVTLTLVGRVTDDAINGCGVLVNCGVALVTYPFDTATPDLNPDPTEGLYAATTITVSIYGVSFFSSPAGVINVANFPAVDQYGLLATGIATNGTTLHPLPATPGTPALTYGTAETPFLPPPLAPRN